MRSEDLPPVPTPPAGFSVRRPSWSDLDGVTALYNEVSRALVGEDTHVPDDLRTRWLSGDRFEDSVIVEDDAGKIVAYAEFHEDVDPWTGELDLYLEGRVHPDRRARGLATFLMLRAERRALLAATRAGPGTPIVLRTAVSDANEAARSWYERLGFEPVRHFLKLRFDLQEQPLPYAPVPEGVRIRRLRGEHELEPFWRMMQAGFADHWDFQPLDFEDWRYFTIERESHADPRRFLVAELESGDGAFVGGAVLYFGRPEDPELGYVKDLAVLPEHRRRGIAMAVLRVAFRRFREQGLRRVGLEVDDDTLDGALRLYERAGMRIARRTDVFAKELLTSGVAD